LSSASPRPERYAHSEYDDSDTMPQRTALTIEPRRREPEKAKARNVLRSGQRSATLKESSEATKQCSDICDNGHETLIKEAQ
jgi:hypothetical protein